MSIYQYKLTIYLPSGNLLQFAIEAMAIEIVSFPMKKIVIFQFAMLNYQRVPLVFRGFSWGSLWWFKVRVFLGG